MSKASATVDKGADLEIFFDMPTGKSIRIYDLAREVKQDTKRVMEDLRREGADVSVASNSVTFEIAEKVRNKYFPKTEAAPKRGIKIIKAAKVVHEEPEEMPAEVHDAPRSRDDILRALVSSGDTWLIHIANELSDRAGLIPAPSRIA